METIQAKILSEVIKKRRSETFKGDYGHVLLIGGNNNYGGAIIMAAEAALNSGAGLICVASHSLNSQPLHSRNPEIMFLDWRDEKTLRHLIPQMDVVICGMGLGKTEFAKQILKTVKSVATSRQTIILDASALDLISEDKSLIPNQAQQLILTPHQMEWQKLSQIRIPFQNDSANMEALNIMFPQKNCFLVLKSNHTKIYQQDGQIIENPIGNPGMATGGTGDTLAGIIGGFCGQFGTSFKTISAAVYLHSLAGDKIAETAYIVKPTKLISYIPALMKKYESNN